MQIPAILVGASAPFSGKDKSKSWMNVHILMDADKPSEGQKAIAALIDPDDFEAGKTNTFPRKCNVGVSLDVGRGSVRVLSVTCTE